MVGLQCEEVPVPEMWRLLRRSATLLLAFAPAANAIDALEKGGLYALFRSPACPPLLQGAGGPMDQRMITSSTSAKDAKVSRPLGAASIIRMDCLRAGTVRRRRI